MGQRRTRRGQSRSPPFVSNKSQRKSLRLASLQIVNRHWKVNPWAGQPKLKSAPAALGQMRSEFLKKLTSYSVVVSPFVPFFFFFFVDVTVSEIVVVDIEGL